MFQKANLLIYRKENNGRFACKTGYMQSWDCLCWHVDVLLKHNNQLQHAFMATNNCSIYSRILKRQTLTKIQPASDVAENLGRFLVWSVQARAMTLKLN